MDENNYVHYSSYDQLTYDWVLVALRETLGLSEVRQVILENYLSHIPGLDIGPTFDAFTSSEEIIGYLEQIVKYPNYIHLFTASNRYDPNQKGDLVTHYQTFIFWGDRLDILDPAHTKTHRYDPDNSRFGQGVWEPDVADDLIIPFFYNLGYPAYYVSYATGACQRSKKDVFCQTWSLLMQLDSIKNSEPRLTTSLKRYTYLSDFYKQIIEMPIVCSNLRSIYYNLVLTDKRLTDVAPKSQRNQILKEWLEIDPCHVVEKMTAKNLS